MKNKTNQRGFSLMSTLFVLVILASLAGYSVRLSTVQHAGTALSVQSARTWFASLSGLEWVIYQLNNRADCQAGNSAQCCADIASGSGFRMESFTIMVDQCTPAVITEGANSYTLYQVELTASSGIFGSVDYVSRKLVVTLFGA